MLGANLAFLRVTHGFSQEEIAERLGVSRQAYARWEKGATVPDIEKCSVLARVYGITLNSLIDEEERTLPAAELSNPKSKNIWGSVTVNDRGQIVIPKGARERFGITDGTRLIVLSDEDGIALIAAERFEKNMEAMLSLARNLIDQET